MAGEPHEQVVATTAGFSERTARRLLGSNRNYIEWEIPHLDRLLVPTATAALEGSGMVMVGHVGGTDLLELVGSLHGQTVLDLAGLQELRDHRGIAYQRICW